MILRPAVLLNLVFTLIVLVLCIATLSVVAGQKPQTRVVGVPAPQGRVGVEQINPPPPKVGAPLGQQAQSLYLARLHSQWAINAAAQRWGVSSRWLSAVAWCESAMTPWAYNYSSSASGLFQFIPSTYANWAAIIGERRSYWNAWGASNVAAWAFSRGHSNAWACAYASAWKLPPVRLPLSSALPGTS